MRFNKLVAFPEQFASELQHIPGGQIKMNHNLEVSSSINLLKVVKPNILSRILNYVNRSSCLTDLNLSALGLYALIILEVFSGDLKQ